MSNKFAHVTDKMNLKLDGFHLISSTSPDAGELTGFRNDDIATQHHDETIFHSMLSVFSYGSETTSFPLNAEYGLMKKSLFCFHNPTLLTMNVSFDTLPWTEDDSLEYHVTITPLLLTNMTVQPTPSMRDATLTITHPVNPKATIAENHYEVTRGGSNSSRGDGDGAGAGDSDGDADTVRLCFNAHYGARVVVQVVARSGPNVVREETLLVEAPDGEVFLPVPAFSQPLAYQHDDSGTPKMTFQSDASYQIVRFDTSAPISDLIAKLYDGCAEQAQYWRLYYHRDVPVFRHNRIGDLPLLQFAQKLTLIYYGSDTHSPTHDKCFHWYQDEERPCIERAERVSDILIHVRTDKGELARWVNTPPLPSPEGEEAILATLKATAPRAKRLWGSVQLIGYNAMEGDMVTLRAQSQQDEATASPAVQMRVVHCDKRFETRIITGHEADTLEAFVDFSTPTLAFLSTHGADVVKITNPAARCGDMGVTWGATIARALLGERQHADPVALDGECTWNTIWTCAVRDPTFMVTIETPYAKSVSFRGWADCPLLLVKLFINAKEGIALSRQKLYLGDKRLDDQHTMGYYHIALGAILNLSVGKHLSAMN